MTELIAAITAAGHDIVRMGSARDMIDKLAAGELPDMVLNCSRSSMAHVPSILEVFGIPCALSSSLCMNLCEHSSTMRSVLREQGIATADEDACRDANCTTVSVAVLGNGDEAGAVGCQCATNVSAKVMELAERTALAAWKCVQGCDAGLVHMMIDNDSRPQVVEVDPLPSLMPDSPLAQMARQQGMSYGDIVGRILASATSRTQAPRTLRPRRPHLASASIAQTL